MRLGLDGCARWRKVTVTVAVQLSWGVTCGWLGLLRAVAQGYSYSCIRIWLVSNFQNNLNSWGVNLGWGLDACARWRKVSVAVTIKLSWV